MTESRTTHRRVIAIAPSTRGFGFAVLEDSQTLADWGLRKIVRDKNRQSLKCVEKLIVHYAPKVIILEDTFAKGSRRTPRIQGLCREISSLASSRGIRTKLFSKEKLRRVFFADRKGSKHARAEIIVSRFPEELSFRLPPKRRFWMNEDARMDIFDAVALALAYFDSHEHRRRQATIRSEVKVHARRGKESSIRRGQAGKGSSTKRTKSSS
jgi:hypothetical protein